MFRRAGVGGLAMAAVVASMVAGCAQKSGNSFQASDAFGLEDANVVVKGNPSGVLGSKFYAEIAKVVADMTGGEDKGMSVDSTINETLGLDLGDVQSIVAYVNVETQKFVVAVTSKKPIDSAAVMAAMVKSGAKLEKAGAHGDVDFYVTPDEKDKVFAFPKPNLIVAGTKDEVVKGLDRLKACKAFELKGKLATVLGAAPSGSELVVVVVPTPGLAKMANMAPVAGAGDIAAKIAAVTVAIKTAATLDLSVLVELKTEKDAKELRDQATGGLALLKMQIGPMLDKAGMEPVKATVESLKIGGSGTSLDVKATVPADITKAAPMIMKLM